MSDINQIPHVFKVERNKSNETVNTGPSLTSEIKTEDLQIDSEKVSLDDSNRCTQCNRYFPSAKLFENHLKTHESNGIFTCIICNKTFTNSDSLTKHLKLHSANTENLYCMECERSFNTKYNLQIHLRNQHREGVSTKLAPCKYCGKKLTLNNLTVHIRRHQGEKPYKCSMCDRGFTNSGDLKSHKRIHTGEKPHDCKICGKVFRTYSALSTHIRVHTGEKPYFCMFCKKRFTQLGSRNQHMRIHTKETPYFCGDCPERFKRLLQLQTHKKKTGHTSETKADLINNHRVRLVASTSGKKDQFEQSKL